MTSNKWTLPEQQIRQWAYSSQVFRRGRDYFREGRVTVKRLRGTG